MSISVTSENAKNTKVCPIINGAGHMCHGSDCMMWTWNEPLFEGPDSYISDPPPLGHCGMTHPQDQGPDL